MKRSTWLGLVAALAVAVAVATACTLIERPGSYFDPTGQLVTLASIPSPQAIALTTSNVYVLAGGTVTASGSTLQWVPKAGGSPTVIAESEAGTLTALATDGVSRVSWCDSTLGAFVLDEAAGGVPTLVQPDVDCAATAISPDRLVYTTDNADGGGGVLIHTVPDAGVAVFPAHGASLAIGQDDVYFVTGGYVIAREHQPSNCYVAASNNVPASRLLVVSDAGDAGELGLFFGLALLFQQSALDTLPCCDPLVADSCAPLRFSADGVGWDRAAVRGGNLYEIVTTLSRVPLASLTRGDVLDATVELAPNLLSATNLAVDDTYAFFSQGDQVQRFTLP